MNGMNASWTGMCTKESTTVVMTWAAVNASASSEALRCRPTVTNRGRPGRW